MTGARAHLHALHRAGAKLALRPLASALSALVIAIALLLPALGFVLVDNISQLARSVRGTPEISLFMFPGAAAEARAEVETRIRADKRLAHWRFVARDEALTTLAQRSGLADVTNLLTENPLPDAFILQPRSNSPDDFAKLRAEYKALPEIAEVQLDYEWISRLHAITGLGHTLVLILGGLFGIALIIVTFNTIRLQILTQRHEIAVSLLLGATRDFVRLPFLYFGVAQGLLGGVLATAGLLGLLQLLNPSISTLAQSFGLTTLTGIRATPWQLAVLIAFAAALGWLGAALSVMRHLHDRAE